MPRIKLTQQSILTRCPPPGPDERTATGQRIRQRIYWDTEVRGFGLVVRPPINGEKVNGTFIVMRDDVNGRPRKRTIGRFGTWTLEAARTRAREMIVALDRGDSLRPDDSVKVTLKEALEMHVADMRARKRTERSIVTIQREVKKYLAEWLNRPLVEISREECRKRHQAMTERHGPYIANRVLRHVRTCWRAAARTYESFPHVSPTVAVQFNEELPSEKRLTWDQLPAWWARVQELKNPVRRDLQVFILLTGLRSTDAKSVRWEDVDFDRGTIHRPNPKGGRKRAFTVPLAGYVLDLLRRRRTDNQVRFGDDRGWAFPARRANGEVSHVREVKEQRYVKGSQGKRKETAFPGPHALRHTFATAGYEAGLWELDLKVLMNHVAPKGDVTRGYVHLGEDHLRQSAERVVGFLLKKVGVPSAGEKRDAG